MATNYDDVVDQLSSAGLLFDGLTFGRLVRCRVDGDRERRGWYTLHELVTSKGDTLIVGSYGVWHGADNGARKIELRKTELSAEQRDSLRRRLAEDRKHADRARQEMAERAAERAAKTWALLSPTGDCEYLARKGIGAHGLRFSPSGAVAVPLLDASSKLHGLQIIRTAKDAKAKRRPQKEFWPAGVVKKGHFHLIGIPVWIVLVAEGYATGASLHEATGLPVAIAFDAGNLAAVAAALRKRYRNARILICADDDAFTDGNPGVTSASSAAVEVGGAFVRPTFADDDARRLAFEKRGAKLSDFNDLHTAEGLHVVRAQIEARLSELAWRSDPRGASRYSTTGGGGGEDLRPIDTLDELLTRFDLVYAQSGTVFDRQEHCLVALSDMRDACVSREIHRAWAEHPERMIVRTSEVGFDPACSDPAIKCNLWSGWPTQPQAGSCDRLLELLGYMCSREHNYGLLYTWVLRWMAYPIQHPGAKLKTTLVLHGPQGTGKNMFFEALMAIYGEYGHVIDQNAIEDKFNDWASKKLFLIADEVIARSDLFHVKNKLKAFITGDWIRINPKNVAAYKERNHVNMVFLSNEAMPVVLEEDDRRHAIVYTPDKLPAEFYASVQAEINNGGIAALHHYLLHLDLGDFNEATWPPLTMAKNELIDLSLDSTSRFFYALYDGEIRGVKPMPSLSQDVYDLYRVWCGRTGMRAAPMPKLLNVLTRKHNVPLARKRYYEGQTVKGPHGTLLLGNPNPPDGVQEYSWLGDSFVAFRNSVTDYKGGGYVL